MGHAALPLCKTLRPPSLLTPFRRGSLPARLGAAAACRYHNTSAPYADRWMLLPLCGIEARGRLRKDVRIQEICVSLVGQELREAAHEHAEARLARRTAIPTSQAVGARPTLEHSSRLLALGSWLGARIGSSFSVPIFAVPCFSICCLSAVALWFFALPPKLRRVSR